MYKVCKRIFDFCLALLALIILLPILIPIIIALLFTGEHEVFYFQKRVGYKGIPFDIWKFATMLKNSESMGTGTITVRNDSRVTFVGKFLRKTKLNELPQLINVLIGNMSIVGPRPLVQKGFDVYPDGVREKVALSKPGITGIGSVIFRDEESLISNANIPPLEFYNTVIAPYKGACEVWYGEHKNFWLDIKIIVVTVVVVLQPNSQITGKWFKGLPAKTF